MGILRTQCERFIELENRGDIEGMTALYDPDAIYVDGTGTEHHGRPAIAEFYRRSREAFPDMHVTLDRVIEEGEWFACQGSWTGTNSGPLNLGETTIPPTGRRVEAAWVSFARANLETGLAVHMRMMIVDQLDFMRQLGLLPTPS